MKRLKIILFIISSHCCFTVQAQTAGQTLGYAQKQFELGNYEDALNAYNRVLFFSPQYGDVCYWDIANCYLQLGNFEKAQNFFDLSYSQSGNDSLKYCSLILKAQSLLLHQDYNYALIELLNLDDTEYPVIDHDRNLLLGITYFCLDDLPEAEKYFLMLLDPEDDVAAAKVKQSMQNVRDIKINPKKARVLSTIFPGLGQFYIGDVKNGANSLLLISGLSYLFIRTAIAYSMLDAGLAVLPWFQRYYMGGYNKAEILAREKIQNKRYQQLSNIIDVVTQPSAADRMKALNE